MISCIDRGQVVVCYLDFVSAMYFTMDCNRWYFGILGMMVSGKLV